MIVKLTGQLVEKGDNTVVLNVHGIHYEILVPISVMQRIDSHLDSNKNVSLIVYHYLQLSPSSGLPVLVGFLSEVERDFFLQFITVSGIGPRAAIKALSKPISQIAAAIEEADAKFLQSLPGIGTQKSKEIIAKLQGKMGKYGLIQDREIRTARLTQEMSDWQQEALDILSQLQYKRQEAVEMIKKALERSKNIQTAEELLNEIYKQRMQG